MLSEPFIAKDRYIDKLTYIITSNPNKGKIVNFNGKTGLFTDTSNRGLIGVDCINVTGSDGTNKVPVNITFNVSGPISTNKAHNFTSANTTTVDDQTAFDSTTPQVVLP
jgi:hypothetical protein